MRPLFLALLTLAFLVPQVGNSAPPYVFGAFKKRQASRESSRWTLAGWMAQKQKFAAMDHWLAMNTSTNIFEMFIGAAYWEPETRAKSLGASIEDSDIYSRAELGLFITMFGLLGEWSRTESEVDLVDGRLQMRLFGKSSQSTSLSVFYGQQNYKNEVGNFELRNNFYGGELEIYITKWMGLTGHYRILQEGESDTGEKRSGGEYRAGLFLEWGLIRLFGQWRETDEDFTSALEVNTNLKASAIESGLRLYF